MSPLPANCDRSPPAASGNSQPSPEDAYLRAFEQEAAAFERLLPDLLRAGAHRFVAVYDGAVVDEDDDELALAQRVGRTYPNQFVLIRRVRREAQEYICLDSPEGVQPGATAPSS